MRPENPIYIFRAVTLLSRVGPVLGLCRGGKIISNAKRLSNGTSRAKKGILVSSDKSRIIGEKRPRGDSPRSSRSFLRFTLAGLARRETAKFSLNGRPKPLHFLFAQFRNNTLMDVQTSRRGNSVCI